MWKCKFVFLKNGSWSCENGSLFLWKMEVEFLKMEVWRDKSAWHLLLSWSCLAIIVFNKFQLFLTTWMLRLYMYYVNPKIVDTFVKLWKNRRQNICEKMPKGTFTVCLFTFPKIWLVRKFWIYFIKISPLVISTFKFLIIDIEAYKQNTQALILSWYKN